VSQPSIVLYGNAGTPYTEKVLGALRFKHLEFEFIEPSSPEDLRRWNPETGLLPVITIDDERTHDSSTILDRLESLCPDPPLLSKDPKTAREQRRLEDWASETFGFYMMRWVRAKVGRETGPKTDAEGQAIGPLARLGLIGEDGQITTEMLDTSDGGPGPEFERRIGDLVTMLGDREFFYSSELSRADLSIYAALFGMYTNRFPGGQGLLGKYPTLVALCDRVRAATTR